MHNKLPQSTVKRVLPSNESYESKTGCNRTLPTVFWVPLISWELPTRDRKTMTATAVTGLCTFMIISPPGSRAIFSTFWGNFLVNLHIKSGEKGKIHGRQFKKSSGEVSLKLQIFVPCRGRTCPDQTWLFQTWLFAILTRKRSFALVTLFSRSLTAVIVL